MAGGKLSPRQKMINMMYLVLTALLALNVSKEILKSFHLMEVSFNKAKENLASKIDLQMKAFAKQAENDPTLVPYYNRALEAKTITDDFVAKIDGIKKELEDKTGGREELADKDKKSYEAELVKMDDMENHANYFMVEDKGKRGKDLEKLVNDTRAKLIAVLDSDTAKGVSIEASKKQSVEHSCQLMAALDPNEKGDHYPSWSAKYLEHSPLASVMTLLTKMQTDARSTQSAVLDVLNQGDVPELKIESMEAVVKPLNGSVIMKNGTYQAEIFLAAKTKGSENDEYIITQGGSGGLTKEGGKMIYKANGGSSGEFKFAGKVNVKTAKGTKEYPFESTYQVFEGGATISADLMNVLYIGIDNQISVGVPGVNPNDVSVTMSGGSISRSGGKYVARVSSRGEAVISASAKMSDGTTRSVGSQKYRIKKLPTPIAQWGAIASGTPSPKPALLAQNSIFASMGEGFVVDGITYSVTSYQFVLAPRRGEAFLTKGNGGAINGAMKGAIQKANRGDRIIVDQIRATGPGGSVTLQPIMIEII
ncbi:MAG: gliding motility protein GldM [Flavobacteriales bacterium]|nr:gliding motility protein GldM [Flavobacteriales bacterium]